MALAGFVGADRNRSDGPSWYAISERMSDTGITLPDTRVERSSATAVWVDRCHHRLV